MPVLGKIGLEYMFEFELGDASIWHNGSGIYV